jgi:hypothetical protein
MPRGGALADRDPKPGYLAERRQELQGLLKLKGLLA